MSMETFRQSYRDFYDRLVKFSRDNDFSSDFSGIGYGYWGHHSGFRVHFNDDTPKTLSNHKKLIFNAQQTANIKHLENLTGVFRSAIPALDSPYFSLRFDVFAPRWRRPMIAIHVNQMQIGKTGGQPFNAVMRKMEKLSARLSGVKKNPRGGSLKSPVRAFLHMTAIAPISSGQPSFIQNTSDHRPRHPGSSRFAKCSGKMTTGKPS